MKVRLLVYEKILIIRMFSFTCVTGDHRETPKALPLGNATPPTSKQDSQENFVESNDLDDCSAQEYEIMKVRVFRMIRISEKITM